MKGNFVTRYLVKKLLDPSETMKKESPVMQISKGLPVVCVAPCVPIAVEIAAD